LFASKTACFGLVFSHSEKMTQMLLFPDPRPLVERLGSDFFRAAPEGPGVYLMRDCADQVLYVGKAKNLRKRLGSYRVANPDRMPRRHLRMLRAVHRIELQPCTDETCALAQESRLLLALRPRFNRAGTWPKVPRFFGWRVLGHDLQLAVTSIVTHGWHHHGPLGANAIPLRASFARLLWCAFHPDVGLAGLPGGWFWGIHGEICNLPFGDDGSGGMINPAVLLNNFFAGNHMEFIDWILQSTAFWSHPFDLAVRDGDLEILKNFAKRNQISETRDDPAALAPP
jgi:hypothetical protein